MKFYIKKIWLLAALQHSRSIRLALLAALQQQQLEMIGYWLLATLQQLVKIRKRLLTNVLSAVKFSLLFIVRLTVKKWKNFKRPHLSRSCREQHMCTRAGHCRKEGPLTRRIAEDMLGSILNLN